jgi:hypothetical protein
MQTFLLAFVIVVGSVALSIGGLWLTRKLVSPSMLQRHHDVAGFLIAIVGLIYGVLQAFVVFVVWTHFENAKAAVETEANCAADIYHISYGLSPALQTDIRAELRAYVSDVVTYEWPAMSMGESSPEADRSTDRLWYTFSTMNPKTTRDTALYQEAISRINEMGNSRRQRLLASRDGVPPVMWVILIFGGVATVAFTYFFGAENQKAQALMTALLTALIAMVLFLIAALDYPFTGDVRVTPIAFQHVTDRFTSIDVHANEQITEQSKMQ